MEVALLPQNQYSRLLEQRFRDSLLMSDGEIVRLYSSTCSVTQSERLSDALDYFLAPGNRAAMQDEFLDELRRTDCGIGSEAADCYVRSALAFQNRSSSAELDALNGAIYSYLSTIDAKGNWSNFPKALPQDNLLTKSHVARILTLNSQHLTKHLDAWKTHHSDDMSDDDIYFRRGLSLSSQLPLIDGFQDRDWITSYSLAISVAEGFSAQDAPSVKAIVSAPLDLLLNRVVFFAPFLPHLNPEELELAVIPAATPIRIQEHGSFGGMREYLLG